MSAVVLRGDQEWMKTVSKHPGEEIVYVRLDEKGFEAAKPGDPVFLAQDKGMNWEIYGMAVFNRVESMTIPQTLAVYGSRCGFTDEYEFIAFILRHAEDKALRLDKDSVLRNLVLEQFQAVTKRGRREIRDAVGACFKQATNSVKKLEEHSCNA